MFKKCVYTTLRNETPTHEPLPTFHQRALSITCVMFEGAVDTYNAYCNKFMAQIYFFMQHTHEAQ